VEATWTLETCAIFPVGGYPYLDVGSRAVDAGSP
jgi:hypothetical protein